MERRLKIVRIVVDCCCLGLAYVPWLCLIFAVTPYKRGFFCDDESISHPYKESTISTLVLTLVGAGLPVIIILVTEAIHLHDSRRHGISDPPFYIGRTSISAYVYRCYKVIGVFLFGLAAELTITNIGKYSIGRLRPHFLDMCKPDYSKFNCTDTRGYHVYITEDVCTGTDDWYNTQMRLSFPSGHASMSMFTMVFVGFYLHCRFTWKGSKLLCPLLQLVLLLLAVFTCLSRVSDYKHHWSDVLTGAISGTLIASLTVIHLLKLFQCRPLTGNNERSSRELLRKETSEVQLTSIESRRTYLTDLSPTPSTNLSTNTPPSDAYYSPRAPSFYTNHPESYHHHDHDMHGNKSVVDVSRCFLDSSKIARMVQSVWWWRCYPKTQQRRGSAWHWDPSELPSCEEEILRTMYEGWKTICRGWSPLHAILHITRLNFCHGHQNWWKTDWATVLLFS